MMPRRRGQSGQLTPKIFRPPLRFALHLYKTYLTPNICISGRPWYGVQSSPSCVTRCSVVVCAALWPTTVGQLMSAVHLEADPWYRASWWSRHDEIAMNNVISCVQQGTLNVSDVMARLFVPLRMCKSQTVLPFTSVLGPGAWSRDQSVSRRNCIKSTMCHLVVRYLGNADDNGCAGVSNASL